MQSYVITAPPGSFTEQLPYMRSILHYDTPSNSVMPLPKAILCQQFNAFTRYHEAQWLSNKAVLASLRMINADQIYHQLRNFNDNRLNRGFNALITLLEEDIPVLILWPAFNLLRLLLRTRHRFEIRMRQYYSTLSYGARVGFDHRHAIRRFAQDGRIFIYIRLYLRAHP